MEKALLYKEWKKTELFVWGIFGVGIILLTYTFLKLGRSFRFVGMEHLIDVIVNRKQFAYTDMKYYPLAAGLCLGLAQYIPEMIQKRIKLTLHLPLNENRIIALMYSYGLGVLLFIFTVDNIGIIVFTRINFPLEIMVNYIVTSIPWYIAGLVAYSFVAMICLEPTWSRRVFNVLIGAGTVKLSFISSLPAAQEPVIGLLLVLTVIVIPFGFLSVYRFKQGKHN
ncbi:hypothetical protein [Saccharicrinis sp. 156]|uniref:hypothetical protein n=1 Tax=Saccharicrinis sp. 156 TaxID=3417574 RepID=UPI003D331036